MTRKDYILIVRILASWKNDEGDWENLIHQFSNSLKQNHPKFNKTKFIDYICKITDAPGYIPDDQRESYAIQLARKYNKNDR